MLLDAGADMNRVFKANGKSALDLALGLKNPAIIKILQDHQPVNTGAQDVAMEETKTEEPNTEEVSSLAD